MCLGQKLSDKSLQRYKAKSKKTGYIRVWKCVIEGLNCYRGYVWERAYQKGFAHSKQNANSEQQLIHAFKCRTSARLYARKSCCLVVIECLVKPQWIKVLGRTYDGMKTLTTKAIVMPAPPEKKVTVAEFRAAIKSKKVKKYKWE